MKTVGYLPMKQHRRTPAFVDTTYIFVRGYRSFNEIFASENVFMITNVRHHHNPKQYITRR